MKSHRQSGLRELVSGVATPPFLLAVALLGAAAVLAGPVADWMDIRREKLALPLRLPLNALDETAIAPYRVLARHVLEPALVEALGTDQYLTWDVVDTSVPENHPLRYAALVVTYDSGGTNLVPHTPDVCRLGAGYQPAQPHENTSVVVGGLKVERRIVPVRLCTFAKTDVFQRQKVSVVYTFFCNGTFVATRSSVRLLINDLSTAHSFFSKVEVSFPRATRSQCLDGARKLLNRVLPVLVSNHWPDFQSAEEEFRRRKAGEAPS